MDSTKARVYLETSLVSYYAGRPSRDLVIAGRQETTRECWPRLMDEFAPHISALVLQEARQGNADAAARRIEVLTGLPVLEIDENARRLAAALVEEGPIPAECPEDALHIALATVNGMKYLLTWNFAHINNAQMKLRIAKVVQEHGYDCPVICTPDELIGE